MLQKCVSEKIAYNFNNYHKATCAGLLGVFYNQENNFNKSFENYSLAQKLDSDRPIYNYNLALTYYEHKDYKKAKSFLKQCIKNDLKQDFTIIQKAECANKLGMIYYEGKLEKIDINAAINNFNLAYQTNSNEILYAYNLAMSYYINENYQEAKTYLRLCAFDKSPALSDELKDSCYEKLLGILLEQ